MPERQEVEKFKITPEMKGFLKTYKTYKQVSDRLRGKMQIELDQVSQTRQMLSQVEKGMQLLTLNSPEKPMFDVEGQDIMTGKKNPQQGMMQDMQMPQGESQGFDPSLNY